MGGPIARGATAEVFAWGERHVLKLYHPGAPPAVAGREAAHARVAHAAGVPTPAVADVVTLEDREGVIFERADGPTMLQALGDRPETAGALAAQLAALHLGVHALPAPGLPAQRQRLRLNIARARGLTEAMKAAATAALEALPDGEAMCHGDFHPGNIIMAAGRPVIIDWLDATRGHPLGDLARTSLLVRHAVIPGPRPDADLAQVIESLRATFHAAYLRRYAESRPIEAGRLEAWILPVTAARLAEPVSAAEQDVLVALVEAALARA